MVNPVTGPVTRTSKSPDLYSVGSYYKTRNLYKQNKPYNLPLPYLLKTRTTEDGYATTTVETDAWGGHWLGTWWKHHATLDTNLGRARGFPVWEHANWSDLVRQRDTALNRVRSRFMSEANQRVALAVDALQLGQTYKLMLQNLQTLKEFALALKSKNPRKVGRALGLLKRHPRRSPFGSYSIAPSDWRSLSADLGSLWLMYSYGWKPFVEDIYNASQILSAPIEPLWINYSTHEEINLHETQTVTDGSVIVYSNDVRGKVFARVGGVVTVKNHNLHTAKNAGITNPASWLWELIPFSFVVDWFFSFGEWINSLDDEVGLSITDGYYTVGMRGTSNVSCILVKPHPGWPATIGRRAGDGGWKRRQFAQMERFRGIPPVKLVRKTKVFTNVNRGLNASSLLAQLLRNSSRGLNVEGKPLSKKEYYIW